jgi:hypothetical protein
MFSAMNLQEVRYNRSYPLNSETEAFDLCDPDPRPIDTDLNKVSIGWDPRALLCLWREMESKFQTGRLQPVEFQFFITSSSDQYEDVKNISTRTEAVKFLQNEKVGWSSSWEKGEIFQRWGYTNPDTPEVIKNASMPVFGFWLFPVSAFNDVPEGTFQGRGGWDSKMVMDLTKHRPQLGVFRLPYE